MSAKHDASNSPADAFELTGELDTPSFELESIQPVADQIEPVQVELFLPEQNPEQPEPTPQIEFEGMAPPQYSIAIEDGQTLHFQHAHTLLESLEAQGVDVHYQCREGYCGSCRMQLIDGAVHYLEEPMAWLDDGQILPCCCVPKSNLKLKF